MPQNFCDFCGAEIVCIYIAEDSNYEEWQHITIQEDSTHYVLPGDSWIKEAVSEHEQEIYSQISLERSYIELQVLEPEFGENL